MMVGMGVGAWLVARARGEKKELSMGCVGGSCNHEEHSARDAKPPKLEEEVARLEREVHTLRAQVQTTDSRDGVAQADDPAATQAT